MGNKPSNNNNNTHPPNRQNQTPSSKTVGFKHPLIEQTLPLPSDILQNNIFPILSFNDLFNTLACCQHFYSWKDILLRNKKNQLYVQFLNERLNWANMPDSDPDWVQQYKQAKERYFNHPEQTQEKTDEKKEEEKISDLWDFGTVIFQLLSFDNAKTSPLVYCLDFLDIPESSISLKIFRTIMIILEENSKQEIPDTRLLACFSCFLSEFIDFRPLFYFEQENMVCVLNQLVTCLKKSLPKDSQAPSADELLSKLVDKITPKTSSLVTQKAQHLKGDLLKFSPKDAAENIAYYFDLHRPSIYSILALTIHKTNVPDLNQFLCLFNGLGRSCSMFVLEPESATNRARNISWLLKVADELKNSNDFDPMTAIASALENSGVHRLHKSWEGVSQNLLNLRQTFSNLCGSNSAIHQMEEENQNGCRPDNRLLFQDLTFTFNGNQLVRENGLISPRTLNIYSSIITRFQNMHKPAPFPTHFLLDLFEMLNSLLVPSEITDQQLFELSLRKESRK